MNENENQFYFREFSFSFTLLSIKTFIIHLINNLVKNNSLVLSVFDI